MEAAKQIEELEIEGDFYKLWALTCHRCDFEFEDEIPFYLRISRCPQCGAYNKIENWKGRR